MQKLVIFDLDGTIIDTIVDLNLAVNYALSKNGFPTKSVEHTRKAVGNGIRKTILRSLPEGTSEEILNKCHEAFKECYYTHFYGNSLPYEGMMDTLKELKNRGYHLLVVTNKDHKVANKLVNYLYPDMFEVIQGHEESIKLKPDIEPLNLAIKKLGVDEYEGYYVGDSFVDYELAKTAHIPAILVSYGYNDINVLKDKIKDATFVDAPIDLLRIIK